VKIHSSRSRSFFTDVVYIDSKDGVAIFSCDDQDLRHSMRKVDGFEFLGEPNVGEEVYILGFPASGFSSHKAALHTTTVNHERAGPKPSRQSTAQTEIWRTFHFYVWNGVVHYGCSGGPALDADGDVVRGGV
jgi:hypothetical protein